MEKGEIIYLCIYKGHSKDLWEKVTGKHILTSVLWGGPKIESLCLSCIIEYVQAFYFNSIHMFKCLVCTIDWITMQKSLNLT